MRMVEISFLKPGMNLGKPVYNHKGEVLLGSGTTLTDSYIKKLVVAGVASVYVQDWDLLPDLAINDVISSNTRVAAVQQVKSILLTAKESGQLVIEPQSIYSTVSEFTDQLLSSQTLVYSLHDLRTQDDYTFAHSVNVCVLALMTGITLGYSKEQLAILGVGAILHDIGKMKIPNQVLNKPGMLTAEEYTLIKEHAAWGYNIIRSAGKLGDIPGIIAYQHHESYDGSGYPQGVSGDEFMECAQIVSIADKFDALTSHRVYRRAFPPHEAYEMCSASGNYWFKDNVVRAFLHNIAAYPTGTVVKLSNGLVAAVVNTPKGFSLFPRVRVLFDQYRRKIRNEFEISLSERPELYIVKVLNAGELQELPVVHR